MSFFSPTSFQVAAAKGHQLTLQLGCLAKQLLQLLELDASLAALLPTQQTRLVGSLADRPVGIWKALQCHLSPSAPLRP